MELKKAIHEEHGTPIWLFQRLNDVYRFGLDAAASDTNHLCEKYFTAKEDALKQNWNIYTSVFCNPPYNCDALMAFTEKAAVTAMYHGTTVVMLVPVKSDQTWWKLAIQAAKNIYFIQGRLYYRGNRAGASFPSAVVVYGDKEMLSWSSRFETMVQPPRLTQREIEQKWLNSEAVRLLKSAKPTGEK